MKHCIYKITNKINGKFYIGKHSTKDLNDDYMGSGKRIKSAIKKYGIENFEKEILYVFENEIDANLKEKELVTEEFCLRNDTYNIVTGGNGSWSHVKDLIPMKNDFGTIFMIHKSKIKDSGLNGMNKGFLICYDKAGNTLRVERNDPRYLSGELVAFSKGKIHVKDSSGNEFVVHKNDPRYLSGELVVFSKGMVTVKDKAGNTLRVERNDPRYLSGELVGINKNKPTSEKQKEAVRLANMKRKSQIIDRK